MAGTTHDTDPLIKAFHAGAVAFLAALNEATRALPIDPAEVPAPVTYDPLHDEPPFTPNPRKSAPEDQQRLASIAYLGAIGRLTADEGRGANAQEVSRFAKRAGYSGGNAVNGWNSRPNSPRAVEVIDGARFLNDATIKWITELAGGLGISLSGELAALPAPTQS